MSVQALNRTGQYAALLTYGYNGNELITVLNNNNAFRSYSYDLNGNATSDGINKQTKSPKSFN